MASLEYVNTRLEYVTGQLDIGMNKFGAEFKQLSHDVAKAGPTQPYLIFCERWGPYSWQVTYMGKYTNNRQMHVEIGEYDTVKKGQIALLSNLTQGTRDYRWTVDDVHNWRYNKPAHFTVAFESKEPLESFAWMEDIKNTAPPRTWENHSRTIDDKIEKNRGKDLACLRGRMSDSGGYNDKSNGNSVRDIPAQVQAYVRCQKCMEYFTLEAHKENCEKLFNC